MEESLLAGQEQARDWYKSPAYHDILHLRTDHIVGDVVLVEGVEPGHTPSNFAERIRETLRSGSAHVSSDQI